MRQPEESLQTILDRYGVPTLRQIARYNGLASTADGQQRKPELVRNLVKALVDVHQIARAVDHLSVEDRGVLDRILVHGGTVSMEALRQEMGQPAPAQPPFTLNPGDPEPQGLTLEASLARLTLHGLVFSLPGPGRPQNARQDLAPGAILHIPSSIRAELPKPDLPPVEWGANGTGSGESTDPAYAQRDLFIYWTYIRSEPVALTQAGWVPRRTLRSINEQLLTPDPFFAEAPDEGGAPRLHFLRRLLQQLGLLVVHRNQLTASGSVHRSPTFWAKPVTERARLCLEAWQNMVDWSELLTLRVSVLDLDLKRARGVMLEQLALLPVGTWVSSERFLNLLNVVAPRMLFQENHRETEADGTTRRGRWVSEVEGAFVGGALSGPLHWMGIVDLMSDEGRLLAFRITPGGAMALGAEPAPREPAAEARLIVQPNFQIFALGPVSEAVLSRLELFADRVRADRSVFEYLLSRNSVYRAQKDGISVNDVLTFLNEQVGLPLPRNVERTLQEWAQQYERVVFHRGVRLMQTATPELYDELQQDIRVSTQVVRQVTPTIAVVKAGPGLALQEALLRRGLLPAVSRHDDRCQGRVTATPHGELSPVTPGPDMILAHCLGRLADERDGTYHITQESVQRAMVAGRDIEDYIEELALIHHGPVPASLLARIRAWGRNHGNALLRDVRILELQDATVAEQLLADPVLAGMLQRLAPGSSSPILIVATDDLVRLRDLLHERGIDLDAGELELPEPKNSR